MRSERRIATSSGWKIHAALNGLTWNIPNITGYSASVTLPPGSARPSFGYRTGAHLIATPWKMSRTSLTLRLNPYCGSLQTVHVTNKIERGSEAFSFPPSTRISL